MKPLIYVTRTIPAAGLKLLKSRKDLTIRVYSDDRAIPRKELIKGVSGAAAILTLLTDKIDAEIINAAGPHLKIVSNYAVGFDNVDLAACAAKNVMVTNTPGVLTDAVAEHAISLMCAAGRRIAESDRFTRAGKYKVWGPLMFLGMQFKGKTFGVIGLGRIGARAAAIAAKGFGMKIMYYDVRRDEAFEKEYGATFGTVDQVLKAADVISIHVPLLPTTRRLIGAKQLKMMKKTAILVNTSRGPIIDEKALVVALKTKRIAAAAIDVYENEPALAPGLTKLENIVLTPHTASATIEARDAMATMAAQAILDAIDGKLPANLIPKK